MRRFLAAALTVAVTVTAVLLASPWRGDAQDPCPSPTPTATDTPTPSAAWKWDARTAMVDPDSEHPPDAQHTTAWGYMPTFRADALVNPNLAMANYAVATADVTNTDPAVSPTYSISLTQAGGTISVRIPLGTRPDPSSDGHLTVRDVDKGVETDFWQAKYNATTRRLSSASAAVQFPIDAVNVGCSSCWAGDAANTPLRRGLVTPEEIAAGKLSETLQFGMPRIGGVKSPPGNTFRFPGLHNAPTCSVCAFHLWEGSWLRLDPSVDVDALTMPSWEKVIAHGLQDRGAINRDNSGSFAIYGKNVINGGAAWATVGLSGNSVLFSATFKSQVLGNLQLLVPPSP